MQDLRSMEASHEKHKEMLRAVKVTGCHDGKNATKIKNNSCKTGPAQLHYFRYYERHLQRSGRRESNPVLTDKFTSAKI